LSLLFAIRPQSCSGLAPPQKPQSIDSLAGPEEDATFDIKDEHSESPLEQVRMPNKNPASRQSLEKVRPSIVKFWCCAFRKSCSLRNRRCHRAPISTVKSRLYRGLDALKAAMQEVRMKTDFTPKQKNLFRQEWKVSLEVNSGSAPPRECESCAAEQRQLTNRSPHFAACKSICRPILPAARKLRVACAPRNAEHGPANRLIWAVAVMSWMFDWPLRHCVAGFEWLGGETALPKLVWMAGVVCGGSCRPWWQRESCFWNRGTRGCRE